MRHARFAHTAHAMELQRPQGYSVRAGTPGEKTPKACRSRSALLRRGRPKPSPLTPPVLATTAAPIRRVVASASALATRRLAL